MNGDPLTPRARLGIARRLAGEILEAPPRLSAVQDLAVAVYELVQVVEDLLPPARKRKPRRK